jgi:hypothetical protein
LRKVNAAQGALDKFTVTYNGLKNGLTGTFAGDEKHAGFGGLLDNGGLQNSGIGQGSLSNGGLGNFDATVEAMKKGSKAFQEYSTWIYEAKEQNKQFTLEQKNADKAVHIFGGSLETVFENALNGTQNFVQGMVSMLEKLIIKFVAAAAAAEVLNLITGGSLGFANIFGQLSGLSGSASSGTGSLLTSSGGSAISSPTLPSTLNVSNIPANNLASHQLVATIRGSDLQLALVRSGIQKSRLS